MIHCPTCDAPLLCGCASCSEGKDDRSIRTILDGDEVGCPVCHHWKHIDRWLDAERKHMKKAALTIVLLLLIYLAV